MYSIDVIFAGFSRCSSDRLLIYAPVLVLTVYGLNIVNEFALNPLQICQSWAIGEFVQHANGEKEGVVRSIVVCLAHGQRIVSGIRST